MADKSDSPVHILKSFIGTLSDALAMRFELFSMEFGEERNRFFKMLVGTLIAAFAFFLGFFMLNISMLLLFWDFHAILAFALTGVYILVGIVIIIAIFRMIKNNPVPFAATIEELKKDKAYFGSEHEKE